MRVTYEEFAGSVLCLSRCIQKIQRMEMVKYGLKGTHAQCLAVMGRYPDGITATALCKFCDKDKAAISRTLSDLTRRGLVERHTRAGNIYRAPFVLTAQGREAAERVNRTAQKAVEQAGEGLTDGDRKIFYATLDLIATNLIRLSEEGIEE